ncbi:MAG: iron-containing alcohol dehydrogenase [Selenomonadaceae bacterium]|nr:iron-containing alcohol dehydrogenase [Selenomonadaceae bacterium]
MKTFNTNPFQFNIPTKIYFGENITETALNQEQKIIKNSVLIVTTGRSLIKYGHLQRLIDLIKKSSPNIEVYVYDKISNNPELSEVKSAVAFSKDKNIKSIIGFGGGSALDAAKAAAVGLVTGADELERIFLNGTNPPENTLPIIAIPTTAGTGSELSKGAILSDKTRHIKSGLRGETILPKAAIVDPVYTWTVPEHITMETGFDVLAHAVETYMAVKSNAYSEMLCEQAIKIVSAALRQLKNDINDHEARAQMCFASMIMGLNLKNIGTCLPHRMQYPVGALTGTSHAAGLIALYPKWIFHEYKVQPTKISNIMKWLNYNIVSNSEEAEKYIRQFIDELGIKNTLKVIIPQKQQVDELAKRVTGNMANDLLANQPNIVDTIYKESWSD